MKANACLLLPLAFALSCSDDNAPPDGYMRLRPPTVTVQPGSSGLWAQWVTGPMKQDMDVVDLQGMQSLGGHHAILYSLDEAEPVGSTRLWKDTDFLSARFIGGLGGDGVGNVVKLPPGVVYRVKAGSSLVIQAHYLNATNHPIDGWTIIDLKLAPASPTAQVASLFASTSLHIAVVPGQSSLTVNCQLPEDVPLLFYSNHMHNYGTKVTTTVGGSDIVKDDPAWSYEWAFNPNFGVRPLASPLILPAGSTLTTTCSWNNDGTETVSFPNEMCVFFGIALGDHDRTCADQKWIE